MEPEILVNLHLEALKLLQQWSVWLITLSSGFLALTGYAFKEIKHQRELKIARLCIGFLIGSVFAAVILVGAIPAAVQNIETVVDKEINVGSLITIRGVYAYNYLDFIPLWILVAVHRWLFLFGMVFGTWLIWLRSQEIVKKVKLK